MAVMQISPEQGSSCAARGSWVPVAALKWDIHTQRPCVPCIAKAVKSSPRHQCNDHARRYWADGSGWQHPPHLGAVGVLAPVASDGHEGAFDFMFIDADKTGYADYAEWVYPIRAGTDRNDNVLWSGSVVDPGVMDADAGAAH